MAEKISEMIYPKSKFSEFGRLFLENKGFVNYYDFATCPGAREAMDSFFSDRPEEIVCLPTGQGFVITEKRIP